MVELNLLHNPTEQNGHHGESILNCAVIIHGKTPSEIYMQMGELTSGLPAQLEQEFDVLARRGDHGLSELQFLEGSIAARQKRVEGLPRWSSLARSIQDYDDKVEAWGRGAGLHHVSHPLLDGRFSSSATDERRKILLLNEKLNYDNAPLGCMNIVLKGDDGTVYFMVSEEEHATQRKRNTIIQAELPNRRLTHFAYNHLPGPGSTISYEEVRTASGNWALDSVQGVVAYHSQYITDPGVMNENAALAIAQGTGYVGSLKRTIVPQLPTAGGYSVLRMDANGEVELFDFYGNKFEARELKRNRYAARVNLMRNGVGLEYQKFDAPDIQTQLQERDAMLNRIAQQATGWIQEGSFIQNAICAMQDTDGGHWTAMSGPHVAAHMVGVIVPGGRSQIYLGLGQAGDFINYQGFPQIPQIFKK